ncbi:MAG: tetratricopeptide repeat protein [Nitrospinaceae bacterium]
MTLVNFALFWQTILHEFVNYDDYLYVNNLYVRNGITFEGVIWAFAKVGENFLQSLAWISLMLDRDVFGLDPAGFHLTNLLLHSANTMLVFLILRSLTREVWPSICVAVLFAVHPLHVESVAWVAERKGLLCAFFVFLTIGAFVRYVECGKRKWYFAAILAFALSLLSKMTLVTLPLVLLLIDYWPANRYGRPGLQGRRHIETFWKLALEKLPLFGLSIVLASASYWSHVYTGVMIPAAQVPVGSRILSGLTNYIGYIWKTLWPDNLSVIYPPGPEAVSLWAGMGAGLLIVVLTVLAVKAARTRPYLILGWGWYLITLFPTAGFITASEFSMADRYTYVPLIGLFIIFAWGLKDLWAVFDSGRPGLIAAAGLVTLLLGMGSWFQLQHWENSVTLFDHAVKSTVNNMTAHNNLGVALVDRERTREGILHFSEALRINPNYFLARTNLASAYQKSGQPEKAIAEYNHALRFQPESPLIHFKLGELYHQVENGERAIFHAETAVRLLSGQMGAQFEKTIEAGNNLRRYYRKYKAK